jgi:hypothetical protein
MPLQTGPQVRRLGEMRVNKARELVVGGYVAIGKNFDSIVVGYYEGDDLVYVARVRNGFTPSLKRFGVQEIPRARDAELPFREFASAREGPLG